MNASRSRSRRSSVHRAVPLRPLVLQQGFELFDQLVDPEPFLRIWQESLARYPSAQRYEVKHSDNESHRGGRPARAFFSAPGGPAQEAFYSATSTLDFLARQCGVRVLPSGMRGTYSYYACPGDYLAIHCDVRTCDIAVVTCLHEIGARGAGGVMRLYPGRSHESLLEIRRTPDDGAHDLRLQPGQTIIMLGGIVPHCILPMVANQSRIVSVLCYEIQ